MRDKLIRVLQAVVLLAVVASFAHAGAGDLLYIKHKATSGSWTKVAESSVVIDNAASGAQTVSLPGPPAAGDLVIFAAAADGSCAGSIVPLNGWTVADNSSLGGNPGSLLAYKVMGGTPDTTVDIAKHSTYAKAMVIQVWRGVDTATPLDNALVTATGTDASPNCPAITTLSGNALVFAVQFLDDDNSTVSAWPTGYTNQIEKNTGSVSDPNFATVALASKIVSVAGAEDPAAYTMSSTDTWLAGTISFRKAP